MEVDAIIVNAETVQSGTWGVSALGLTFKLPDGRTTEITYVPGTWAVGEFLAMFHVETLQDLIGTPLRIALADSSDSKPSVEQIFPPPPVPDVYRKAFDDAKASASEAPEGE